MKLIFLGVTFFVSLGFAGQVKEPRTNAAYRSANKYNYCIIEGDIVPCAPAPAFVRVYNVDSEEWDDYLFKNTAAEESCKKTMSTKVSDSDSEEKKKKALKQGKILYNEGLTHFRFQMVEFNFQIKDGKKQIFIPPGETQACRLSWVDGVRN
jgi:hypothetical protein